MELSGEKYRKEKGGCCTKVVKDVYEIMFLRD